MLGSESIDSFAGNAEQISQLSSSTMLAVHYAESKVNLILKA